MLKITSGTEPAYQIDNQVIKALAHARRRVGDINSLQWGSAVRLRDPVEVLRRGLHRPVICRAYYKLCEMQPFLPREASKILFLCEAPGGFWQAARRLYPHSERFATSLEDDGISFHPMVPQIRGLPNRADIRDRAVTEAIAAKAGTHSFELITGDGGTSHENLDLVEQYSLELLLAQVASALTLQAKGGTLLVKIFEGSIQPTQDVVTVLRKLYKNVLLYKPRTSKAANSERYIIAKQLISTDDADTVSRELFDCIARKQHVYSLIAEPDPTVGQAFEALAARQSVELSSLIDYTTVHPQAREDVKQGIDNATQIDIAWIIKNVECLRGCAQRALSNKCKKRFYA